MKTIKIISAISILFFLFPAIVGQTPCKVLIPELSANYTGGCKSGLAEGMGEATGTDFYKGEFKKGLPDGEGTYIWKNGATYKGNWKNGMRNGSGTYTIRIDGRDSVLTGKWKENRYLGDPNALEYSVEYKNSIGRVSFVRVGERPFVQYKFSRNGAISNANISNLLMQGSSGSENVQGSFTGFEYITFPFKGKINFTAMNSFQTSTLTCELRFTVYAPGSWVITIFY